MSQESDPVVVSEELVKAHIESGQPIREATSKIVWLLNKVLKGETDGAPASAERGNT